MHIKRYIKANKIKRYISIILCMALCLEVCSCGNDRQQEVSVKTPEEIDERFIREDGLYTSGDGYGFYGFDIREMEAQVEGFWDYYENYEESRREWDQEIKDWEGDFLQEGIYEVGKDIPAGEYAFCDPDDPTDSEEENTIERHESASSLEKHGWNYIVFSPYFDTFSLEEGDLIRITGHPKVALVDLFPKEKFEKDGVYYGMIYKIGDEIPRGEYFVLSMDVEEGETVVYNSITNTTESEDTKYLYSSDGTKLEDTQDGYNRYARSRFGYFRVEGEGYVYLENCILISMESKPEIHPVSHENISYANEDIWSDIWHDFLKKADRTKEYDQPVYVQGEYRIGEDIPIGTYQIQNEIAAAISDRESEELHSDSFGRLGYGRYSWTGLVIPYRDMAEQCGWQYIRTSSYGEVEYVKQMAENGQASYTYVSDGELPTVTFTKEDEGCVVRLVRVILVPEEDSEK